MLSHILWKNKNKWQIAGATFGGFIGFALLLFALQVYLDVQHLMEGGSNTDEYVTVNKQVSLLNTLGVKPIFSEKEIKSLKDLSYIGSIGQFTPNLCKVSASSRMLNFYTELFFESLPDDMVDIDSGDWHWEEGQQEIPIVMSRDYLALYNFGFAMSQGLPQFNASTIGKVTFDVTLRGKGQTVVFKGRIIGFSDRINSILVPQTFMTWSNAHYGEEPFTGPSRLILKVDNPNRKEFVQYLEDHHYEVSNGRLIGSRLAAILNALVAVIGGIGVIIMLLSVLIYVLNFQLIISKSAQDIQLLLQIGYTQKSLSRFLGKRWISLFSFVIVFAMGALTISRIWISDYFNTQGFDFSKGLHPLVYIGAAILSISIIGVNLLNIRSNVKQLWS